jgi:hypothetical protein
MSEAKELLRVADELATWAEPETAGLWPRACALLTRQALEISLDDFWRSHSPGVEHASMRAQLLCLKSFVDEDAAERASHVWWALSRACHHHPYELAPTADELTAWIQDVEALHRVLSAQQGATS